MDKIRFIQYPNKCNHNKYSNIINIANNLFNKNDIDSIYTFGKINNPGISDLDILIVLNQSSSKIIDNIKSELYSDDIIVDTFFIDKSNKKYLYKYACLNNLEVVSGDDYEFEKYDDKFQEINYILIILTTLIPKYNKIKLMLNEGLIRVKLSLLLLHSICHSITIKNKLLETTLDVESIFTQKVSELRSRWFDNDIKDNRNKLTLLMEESIIIAQNISKNISQYFDKYIIDKDNSGFGILETSFSQSLVCSDRGVFNKPPYKLKYLGFSIEINHYSNNLFKLVYPFSNTNNSLSDTIKDRILNQYNKNIEYSNIFKEFVNEHCEILNKFYIFDTRYKLKQSFSLNALFISTPNSKMEFFLYSNFIRKIRFNKLKNLIAGKH